MGISFSEINFDKLVRDLSECCLGEEMCSMCDKKSCIVGYAQNCIVGCARDGVSYIEGGDANIPFTDLRRTVTLVRGFENHMMIWID